MNTRHAYCERCLVAGVAAAVVVSTAVPATPADLQPRTVAAFDRYVQVAEAGMSAGGLFLWVDGLPESEQDVRRNEL